jgi:hypothetical protein
MLRDMKHQFDQLGGCSNCHARKVVGVEYLRPLVCFDGRVMFTNIKFQNNDDVRIMFSIFYQYCTKGSNKLDATLVRCVLRYMFKLNPPEDL